MSLSARRPLEDTLTSSPSSSSIAEKERKRQKEHDSILDPPREPRKKVQAVLLYFHIVIAEVEHSTGSKDRDSAESSS